MMHTIAGRAPSTFAPRTRLQDERIQRHLSQVEVAEEVGTTGLNVSRWERGITRPHPYYRDKLCQMFGKAAWELDLETPPEAVATPASRAPIFDPCLPLRPPRPLVGRSGDLAAVKARLYASANGSVVALLGLPGIGKTTLAWAVAQATHIRQYFNGGVLWVSLGREPDLSQLLSRWGALLGIPASTLASLDSLQKWIGTLSNAIGTRRMLLVIDDAWSSVDVDVFRVGGPNCAHLVTTRFPSVAALAATPPTMPIPIRELAEAESLVLLQRLAPETKGCALSRVRSFVQSVGGHPLALKQAGSYLHRTASMAGREVVSASLQRLAKPGVLLQLSELPEEGEWYPGLAPGVSPSLEAVIASLCQGLTEKARAALAALTVFPPKPHVFAEGEALAAAQCSLEALDELLEAGLLEPCAGDSYSLHAVIAAYAWVFLVQER